MYEWRPSRLSLSYRIGPLTLFSWRFSGVTPRDYFTAWPAYPDCEQKILGAAAGLPVAVFRSQPLSVAVPRLRFANARIWYIPCIYRHQLIQISGDFGAYLKRLSKKSRSTLQRKVKKFRDHFEQRFAFEVFRSTDELRRFHSRALKLSELTYQARVLGSGLPATEDFLSSMDALGSADSVRAFLLAVDGHDVAYLYCPAHEGILFYSFLGYDPEFAEWSPGTVLQYLALQTIFDEACFRWFDFEEGEGQHKATFATHSIPCCDLFVFRPTIGRCLAVMAHWALMEATRIGIAAQKTLHLHRALRRLLRRKRMFPADTRDNHPGLAGLT
jgi:CelD/BcsL family acetyltransferase involved in cellulose biosynthesis